MKTCLFFILILPFIFSSASSPIFSYKNLRQLQSNTIFSVSNASNVSNTSNSSEPFIYIPDKTPTSTLNSEETVDLLEWIIWKNDFTRYDSHFDPVPKVFAPEKDYYKSSILLLGLPFFLIGTVIMFIGLLFCIFRYGLGICGGRKSKNIAVLSRFSRNFTFVLTGLGSTLWFIGTIIALTGALKYNNALEDTQNVLLFEGNLIESQVNDFSTVAHSINNENLTWANDTKKIFELPISTSYPFLVAQTKAINEGSSEFSEYLSRDNSVFLGFAWFFFFFGFFLSGLLVFVIVKKMGSFANVIGIFYIVLSAMAFGVAGFYFCETIKAGDICEQNHNILAFNYPESSQGILKFMDRFIPTNEKLLFEEKYQTNKALTLASDFFVSIINITNASVASNIKHQTDIIDLYNNQSLSENKNLTLWGRITKELNDILVNINDLKDYDALRRYSVKSEETFCSYGISNLYLAFVGTIIMGIAFLLLLIAGIQLKDILEKLKLDKESMINVRQAGGYA